MKETEPLITSHSKVSEHLFAIKDHVVLGPRGIDKGLRLVTRGDIRDWIHFVAWR